MTRVQKRLLVVALVLAAAVVVIVSPLFFLVLAACAVSGWIGYRSGRARTNQQLVDELWQARSSADTWQQAAIDRGVDLRKARDEIRSMTVDLLSPRLGGGRVR